MNQNIHNALRLALAVLLLIAVPSVGMSQSIWLPPSKGHSVSLEVFKVDWSGDRYVTFASSAWFLTGRYQASPSITIVGELPLSHFDRTLIESFGLRPEGAFDPEAETVVGNPYLGIQYSPVNTNVTSELGVRFPITADDKPNASVNGWISEFDRWEAFIPDLLTARGRIGGKVGSRSGNVQARFLTGGTWWIPTEDGDLEVFVDAIGQFWFQHNQIIFGATLYGRSLLTQDGLSITERSEFQFGLNVNATIGNVRPGFHVHIPLKDKGLVGFGGLVDVIFGVNITFLLGEPKRYDDWE